MLKDQKAQVMRIQGVFFLASVLDQYLKSFGVTD